MLKFEKPEPLTKPVARTEEEVVGRNFRITNRILENYGHTPGCIGCEAALAGGSRGRKEHTDACRNRIENKMLEDPDEKGWIEKRDKGRPNGKATSSTSAAPEVLRATGKDQNEVGTHDDELMNEVGGSADTGDGVPVSSPEDVEVGVEADEEHDVLYGPEVGKSEDTRPEASVLDGNPEHEPEAKRRKLANVHGSKARFAQVLRSQKYAGSLQETTARTWRASSKSSPTGRTCVRRTTMMRGGRTCSEILCLSTVSMAVMSWTRIL